MTAEGRTSDLSGFLKETWKVHGSYVAPGYGRRYRTPMWEFVRRAKTHPDLERLNAYDAAAMVERCIERWEDAKTGGDIWQTYFPASDDAKAEFVDTWDRIKWPRAALDLARAEVAKLPLKPTQSCSLKYSEFIGIAGHLQRAVDGPILLPCVRIAALLDCEPMTVSRYRRVAQQDGLLKLERKGIRAQRKADEFRFAVESFDWKTGNQITSETLNICLTSSPKCYTEIQENQETERKKESQDKQETKENQEKQREAGVAVPVEKKKHNTPRQGPHIPTTAELAQTLQKTTHLRKG